MSLITIGLSDHATLKCVNGSSIKRSVSVNSINIDLNSSLIELQLCISFKDDGGNKISGLQDDYFTKEISGSDFDSLMTSVNSNGLNAAISEIITSENL